MPAEQSNAPEDTFAAREEGLTADDFSEEREQQSECPDVCLTAEMILDADDVRMERVACPEWGGYVYVKAISGTERNRLEADMVTTKERDRKEKLATLRERLIVISACNKRGELIFNRSHLERLGRKNAAPLDRLFAKAQRLCGMTSADVDELTKN